MAQRYKNGLLQERVIKERRQEEEQEALRKKYGIPGKHVVQIKKEHLFTAVAKVLGKIIRKIITVLLIVLAFNGLVSWLYPASRTEVLQTYEQFINQVEAFYPPATPIIEKVRGIISE